MRSTTVLLALACLATVASQPRAAEPVRQAKVDPPKAAAEHPPSFKVEHPGDTALSQDEKGNWRYKSFPALATLYTFDKDTPGKSNCGAPCTSAWAPFVASSTENEPIGDWTLIPRSDGRQQWAYKGRPVYVRYHDLSSRWGEIERQGFRKLEP
jgi:predicted lipoprotein with Yx(FWY)xxD motif